MEIAISTSEADHVALSTAFCETASIMHLLKEISAVMGMSTLSNAIKDTIFKDNNGAIDLDKALKMRP